jgi:hypothetical protein
MLTKVPTISAQIVIFSSGGNDNKHKRKDAFLQHTIREKHLS